MTTLSDLVLVTLDPRTGNSVLKVRSHGYKLLGGAALYDLTDRRRLRLEGRDASSHVVVSDPSPVPKPSLEFALGRMRRHDRQLPRNAVLRLCSGTKTRSGIYGGLVTEGVIAPWPGETRRYRFRVVDLQRREQLIAALHAALLGGRPCAEPVRRLAGLLVAGDGATFFPGQAGELMDIVVSWPGAGQIPGTDERRRLRETAVNRAKALAGGDWIAEITAYSIALPEGMSIDYAVTSLIP